MSTIATKDGTRTAWGIAVNHKCDLVVALVVGKVDSPAARQEARPKPFQQMVGTDVVR